MAEESLSDSLGSLVDRLSIVNIKIYNVQDWLFKVSMAPLEEFKKQSHEEIQSNLKKLANLNLDRNKLMTAIDQCLDDAVRTGKAQVDTRDKVT